MAILEMKKIVEELRSNWDIQKVYFAHKLGECPVGDASVAIYISSCHRKEALEATQFAINRLKDTVPIWKKVNFTFISLKIRNTLTS
jgi:molybdopterin synthase catalytic subunit